MTLVEAVNGSVTDGTSSVDVDEDSETEVNVVVLDTFIFVGISELESKEECGI